MAGPDSAAARAETARPKKVADAVADRIRQMIARGDLNGGDWLPTEPELMVRFGVSRATLREAFRLLESDSLIRIRRGPPGGAQVRTPGPEAAAPLVGLLLTLQGATLGDVYDAQAAVEPAAIRRLTESGSKADHREVQAGLARLKSVFGQPTEKFSAEVTGLHTRIIELSGSRTLATMIGILTEVMSRHISGEYVEPDAPVAEHERFQRKVVRDYERLVSHVVNRDGDGAEAFWRKHMAHARPIVLAGVEQQVVELLG